MLDPELRITRSCDGRLIKGELELYDENRCNSQDRAHAFEQFGIPKGHTGPAEEMFEAVNAGWMNLGVEGTEHVAGTTPAREVFAAAQKAVTA